MLFVLPKQITYFIHQAIGRSDASFRSRNVCLECVARSSQGNLTGRRDRERDCLVRQLDGKSGIGFWPQTSVLGSWKTEKQSRLKTSKRFDELRQYRLPLSSLIRSNSLCLRNIRWPNSRGEGVGGWGAKMFPAFAKSIWKQVLNLLPLIPSPSPHKFGSRWIEWHVFLFRICGEKGANFSRVVFTGYKTGSSAMEFPSSRRYAACYKPTPSFNDDHQWPNRKTDLHEKERSHHGRPTSQPMLKSKVPILNQTLN